jgi:hypothetical protein
MRVAAVTILAGVLFIGSVWLFGPRARQALLPGSFDAMLQGTPAADTATSDLVIRAASGLLHVVGVELPAPDVSRRPFASRAATGTVTPGADRAPSPTDHAGSGGTIGGSDFRGDSNPDRRTGDGLVESGGGSGGSGGAGGAPR